MRAACTWDFCTMQMMQKQAVAGPSRPKVILFLSTNGITRLSCCSTEPLLGAITDPNVLARCSQRKEPLLRTRRTLPCLPGISSAVMGADGG